MSAPVCAHASLTVLIGEPFGNFGTMMPVGHAAVYLDRVCADGPLKLRMCRPGENAGVVVARYHSLGPYDWMATPILQFLYATDRPEEVPAYVTATRVWEMRQSYRRSSLLAIVPDGSEKGGAMGEWWETVGMAYNRTLWGYRVDTTEEQDERFVARMNADPNRHMYRLGGANCANFAADVVTFFLPSAVPRGGRAADFGVMTPKQLARSLGSYGATHPEVHLRILKVPQVAGDLRRSRPLRGGAEALLKTKRYLATLLVIQPEVPLALWAVYRKHGRWTIGEGAETAAAADFVHPVPAGGDTILAAR
ncbi:MAG: DUF4105 domain-containing protein [Acidobacteriota bacterium]|nr:DUF4105 domain-containing protein [Acidobacteriota bacterium]